MTTPERRVHSRSVSPPSLPCGPSRISRRLRLAAIIVFLFSLTLAPWSGTAAADQKPYALIFGTVFSAEGRVVYGVTVKVRRADKKKALQEYLSDHNGEFAFRVPPGPADYIVWADIKLPKEPQKPADPLGVTDQTKPGSELKVHVQADERVDISLHLPESFKPY